MHALIPDEAGPQLEIRILLCHLLAEISLCQSIARKRAADFGSTVECEGINRVPSQRIEPFTPGHCGRSQSNAVQRSGRHRYRASESRLRGEKRTPRLAHRCPGGLHFSTGTRELRTSQDRFPVARLGQCPNLFQGFRLEFCIGKLLLGSPRVRRGKPHIAHDLPRYQTQLGFGDCGSSSRLEQPRTSLAPELERIQASQRNHPGRCAFSSGDGTFDISLNPRLRAGASRDLACAGSPPFGSRPGKLRAEVKGSQRKLTVGPAGIRHSSRKLADQAQNRRIIQVTGMIFCGMGCGVERLCVVSGAADGAEQQSQANARRCLARGHAHARGWNCLWTERRYSRSTWV